MSRGRGPISTVERAGNGGRNVAAIDLVHIGIMVEVGEEDGGLDNFVERAAGGREDRRHVGERGRRLGPDVAPSDDAADSVERQLACDEDETARPYGLRIGAEGSWGIGCDDRIAGHGRRRS